VDREAAKLDCLVVDAAIAGPMPTGFQSPAQSETYSTSGAGAVDVHLVAHREYDFNTPLSRFSLGAVKRPPKHARLLTSRSESFGARKKRQAG
jgi:hypothetical protein